MAIRSIDSPNAAQEAVLDGMQRRSKERGFWTPELRKADPCALELCNPHRIAFLALKDVRPQTSLRATALILGWRFLIFKKPHGPNDEPIAAAHAVLAKDGRYRLSELNEGEFVKGTRDAFRNVPPALLAPPIDAGSNPLEEILLLFTPAVYFAGLWARYQREEDDVVLPIKPTSRELHSFVNVPIPTAKLLAILYNDAKKVPYDGISAG